MGDTRFIEHHDPDGTTRWRIDAGFITSTWRCIWGAGCQGIGDERHPELMDGCCSVGVVLTGDDEAMAIAALAATIDPLLFQHHGHPIIERRGAHWATVVVDGACVFLNRPGFDAGAGCALHLAAVNDGEDPLEWKPQTCTRMPLRVDERRDPDGTTEVTVRAWQRDDWGPGGATMAWWCVDAPEAYGDDDVQVRHSMAGELEVLFGPERWRAVDERLS